MAKETNHSASLGFENQLWRAAGALRSNMGAAERDNPPLKSVLPNSNNRFTPNFTHYVNDGVSLPR